MANQYAVTRRQLLTQSTSCDKRNRLPNGEMPRIHSDLRGRITVDKSRDYSRQDGDTRDGSDLPAVVLAGEMRVGEVYNAFQAETWLVSRSDIRIVCRDE